MLFQTRYHNRPSVIESAEYEDELGYYVYDDADEGPEDPEADGLGVGEGGEALECGDGDEECYAEDGEAGEAQDPEREWC